MVLLWVLLMQLPLNGSGQDFLQGICRIEEGRMIFRIDLNWTREQLSEVTGKFDLDSLLLGKILRGMADSMLLADGWQWKKINSHTAEISKSFSPTAIPNVPPVNIPPPSKLFLLDDKWMTQSGFPEAEDANYGANNLSEKGVFTYSDSLARFILPGYPQAGRVYLSGTFNDWSTMQTPMERTGDGWMAEVPLKPGKYLYKYIIDGRWTHDANNKFRQNDRNGGYNSVIFCYNYRFALKGFTDARKVFVAGSFNGFNPRELVMQRTVEGWELPLYVRPGTHAYKFLVDGRWMNDPANPVVRPDGRGNFNSFMGIGDTTWFRLAGHQTAQSVILSGSFNDWNTAELTMEKSGGGWQLPYVLAPGNYEYKFIEDGRWMVDSANPYVNGEGRYTNSFLAVQPNHTFVVDTFPDARSVAVTGSFSGWNKSGYRMHRENNRWVLPVFLKPGKYTYKIVLNGNMILDPGNELWEENEYGTGNSVLWIVN
jgi:1,4-alpha-glucan branching enzyme